MDAQKVRRTATVAKESLPGAVSGCVERGFACSASVRPSRMGDPSKSIRSLLLQARSAKLSSIAASCAPTHRRSWEIDMKVIVSGAALLACWLPAAAAWAGSPPLAGQDKNWGQEVKSANQNNGYPGGTSRGGYVSGQARDSDGPGYGHEVQSLGVGGYSNSSSGHSLGSSRR